ncbi:MAG: efflux RND transporter permease subunit [Spirochaetales bacterium]|nr:efflux RND transporter permease subunit [Spirochaetales bacterium]
MKKIIEYFSSKHILTNFVVIGVFIGAVFLWDATGKEETPNITFDMVFISAYYPGATAEEVESLVTKPIEDSISGIDGINAVNSSSAQGSCSLRVELEDNNPNRDEVIQEIKDAVAALRFPADMENAPSVREMKPSRRSVIDFVFVYKDADMMTPKQRTLVQSYADTLEDRLLRLPQVSEVNLSGYYEQYIEIQLNQARLLEYNLSMSEIISALRKNNLKQPVGSLSDELTTKIRLDAELDDTEKIKNVIIQASFEGNILRIADVAKVVYVTDEEKRIVKVNGMEAVRLTVTKTSSTGILEAIDRVKEVADEFSEAVLKGTEVDLILTDDESRDVRNRLSLISYNGLFGFVLIIIILFIFLNARSGIWVAMGIPFSLGFTMILSYLFGFTVNNITLAAVIIVLGMVVDDAIVVAENVGRLLHEGVPLKEAVARGTVAVFLPILASITTTCVAFIPIFFFKGHFSLMIKFIPPIIFFMLGGSLFESLFILPAHLRYRFPRWIKVVFSLGLLIPVEKYFANKKDNEKKRSMNHSHWFIAVENAFGRFLKAALRIKWVFFIVFVLLLIYSGWIFATQMKYSLFPREETTSLFLSGRAPEGTLRLETEKMVRPLESLFKPLLGKEVVSIMTNIARGWRGSAVRENEFSISIEIVPKDMRKKSANELIAEWEEMIKNIKGFEYLRFAKSRWGQSSGSAIDIIVKENDNNERVAVVDELLENLKRVPSLKNPEQEVQLSDPEYRIILDRDLATRLGISADTISTTLRTILQGNTVYTISRGGKDIDVRITVPPDEKATINELLNTKVPNSSRYLVPLNKVVRVEKVVSPSTIVRLDGKRVQHVYAELNEADKTDAEKENNGTRNQPQPQPEEKKDNSDGNNSGSVRSGKSSGGDGNTEKKWGKKPDEKTSGKPSAPPFDLPAIMTPLEVADFLEAEVFPGIMHRHPSTELTFGGEIADTRESGQEFIFAIIMVIFLIYVILALTLNSLVKPFIIMLSIPFGCVGIILALQAHGMMVYGFFSIIGALGLAGVVVNDSIVLLAKLEKDYHKEETGKTPGEKVANISKTRLRAVLLTTITTVAGLLPTAYGVFGYDSMLAEMMLTLAWGLMFGTFITLLLVPSLYCTMKEISGFFRRRAVK